MEEYTSLVYSHDSLVFLFENNVRSVMTKSDIIPGTLLMLEHGYCGSRENCAGLVSSNRKIFNDLHPRRIDFDSDIPRDRLVTEAMEKVNHNCFGIDKKILITEKITQINHSCKANCHCIPHLSSKIEEMETYVMELYAIKQIPADTEITIGYGPENCHKRDFVCPCQTDLEQRKKYFEVSGKLARSYRLRDNTETFIKKKLEEYYNSPKGSRINLNHFLAYKEIFFNEGVVKFCTPSGHEFLLSFVKKFLGECEMEVSYNMRNLTFENIIEIFHFIIENQVMDYNELDNMKKFKRTRGQIQEKYLIKIGLGEDAIRDLICQETADLERQLGE